MTDLPPLAERVRPRTLEELIGQEHLTAAGQLLFNFIQNQFLPSLVFWGPPGVGKTTLVYILASALGRELEMISAVQAGVKEIRVILESAKVRKGLILFIDEIHRFNKAQQDALLHAVETGLITLIGATTENPSFEIIPALLSRCQVLTLRPLTQEAIAKILKRALQQDSLLKKRSIEICEYDAFFHISNGDARKALNLLELCVLQHKEEEKIIITNELVARVAQRKSIFYDKAGEQHYDIISAFIKSIRGSDPNAALYWLARMLEGGEDVQFIARRMIILASEDIGNANPNALVLATSCFQAVSVIGMPEARIILAQCAVYLATSLKSNASYVGIEKALEVVRTQHNPPVPLHLRNPVTDTMKDWGYGKNYLYEHDFDIFNPMARQEFMPPGLEGKVFYLPKPIGKEKEIQQFIRLKWGEKYSLNSSD
ncbi:MAG: replication-associated recombination protein A [Bacteroidia bacterium]|nr:replication-associated recombination protein A [Bacteroidia bacterium]MDW8159675.1 replication-associated recombination protein A [Bacteroidia bacterium]